ncbi:MAG TPA: 50S ribosomal protein L11 [archaeon]|nr:50S ribosomal protein L11 [archaeon]
MSKETIDMLIEGGKAAPNAAIAPKFSALKLDVNAIFKEVNDKTKDYAKMQVPVKIIIDKDTKQFEIVVGIPPTSSLIKKEAGVELAKVSEEDKAKGNVVLGNLSMEQCVKVAKMKREGLLAKDLKAAVKQVVGTANSMSGINVENKRPKEIIQEIDEGKWDHLMQ